jgi:hypothetical protein
MFVVVEMGTGEARQGRKMRLCTGSIPDLGRVDCELISYAQHREAGEDKK